MEKKVKLVEKEIYVTKDGKEFDFLKDASLHEDFLTGKKKYCKYCDGKGIINERIETVQEESYVIILGIVVFIKM